MVLDLESLDVAQSPLLLAPDVTEKLRSGHHLLVGLGHDEIVGHNLDDGVE